MERRNHESGPGPAARAAPDTLNNIRYLRERERERERESKYHAKPTISRGKAV